MGDEKNIAVQILIVQVVWLIAVSGFDVLLHTAHADFAFSMGCISAIIPHLLFSVWAFRAQGARSAKKILGHFFVGEAVKLIVSGVLISAVLMSQKFSAVPVIIGFMSTVILGQVIAPFVINVRHLR